MKDFVIVASALVVFLGLGIAIGLLIIVAFSRRGGPKDPDGGHGQEPPEDDEKPPWYGR